MAVCAGITYDAEDEIITVSYDEADGNHGSTNGNEYNFEDIYDTDQDNSWGVFSKVSNVYTSNAAILFTGTSTHFKETNYTTVIWNGTIAETNLLKSILVSVLEFHNCTFIDNTGMYTTMHLRYPNDGGTRKTMDNCSIFGFYILNLDYIDIKNTGFINTTVSYFGNYGTEITFENCTMVGCSWGFMGNPYQAGAVKNIQVIDGSFGIYVNIENFTLRDIKVINCSYDYYIRGSGSGKVTNLINPEIDVDNYGISGPWDFDIIVNLQTEFVVNIENGDGGTATIYDKDDNEVASTILSGEWTPSATTYVQRDIELVDNEVIKNDKNEYEPFTLEVTKSGYQELEITGITVTAGDKTSVFAKMKTPTYISDDLTATITEENITSSITEDSITAEVND